MTPKEKAEELVGKYLIKVRVSFTENSIPTIVNAQMLYISAKECALIAVNEILDPFRKVLPSSRKYWEEVKTEIEKL